MLKNLKRPGLWLFVGMVLIALTIMTWKGCRKEPDPAPINVPALTPPGSVTSEPTQAELDILEREKQRRIDYPTDEDR